MKKKNKKTKQYGGEVFSYLAYILLCAKINVRSCYKNKRKIVVLFHFSKSSLSCMPVLYVSSASSDWHMAALMRTVHDWCWQILIIFTRSRQSALRDGINLSIRLPCGHSASSDARRKTNTTDRILRSLKTTFKPLTKRPTPIPYNHKSHSKHWKISAFLLLCSFYLSLFLSILPNACRHQIYMW